MPTWIKLLQLRQYPFLHSGQLYEVLCLILQMYVHPAVKQNVYSPGWLKIKWFTDVLRIYFHCLSTKIQSRSLIHILALQSGHFNGNIVTSWMRKLIEDCRQSKQKEWPHPWSLNGCLNYSQQSWHIFSISRFYSSALYLSWTNDLLILSLAFSITNKLPFKFNVFVID